MSDLSRNLGLAADRHPAEEATTFAEAPAPMTVDDAHVLMRAIDAIAEAQRLVPGAGHLDPVLSIALRRVELLELGTARAVALLPPGALGTRLRELIPGRRIPTAREALMTEWRRPAEAPRTAEERAAHRRELAGEAGGRPGGADRGLARNLVREEGLE